MKVKELMNLLKNCPEDYKVMFTSHLGKRDENIYCASFYHEQHTIYLMADSLGINSD